MTALRETQIALLSDAAPFAIRAERAADAVAREALLDACFGANRRLRTCQRLRDGRAPAEGLALSAIARDGMRDRLVGTLRLWHVSAGGVPALMLGPLAVDPMCRKLGIGGALMNRALAAAKARGGPAGRCFLLRPLRLLRPQDRRIAATRPVRARPPARPRTARGRPRRRLGDDRAHGNGGTARQTAVRGKSPQVSASRGLI
jgi:GNAT superfamily N-acetyltransferase